MGDDLIGTFTVDQTEMEESTTLGRGNFDYQFRVLYRLRVLNCDGKRGFAAVLGVKWGLNQEKFLPILCEGETRLE